MPAMPPPAIRYTRWHNIGKALTRAAGSSITAALGRFVDYNYRIHSCDDHDASPEDKGDDDPYGLERTLPPNHPHNVRVRRMAANLIAAACDDKTYAGRRWRPLSRIRRPFDGVDWTVDVIDDDYAVNAFSFADGSIYVYSGYIRYTRTDAHIASVLGHEIGHVIAGHAWEHFRNSYWVGVLVNMTADLLELPRDILAQDKWESIFMQPCLFRQEYEADHFGVLLLAAAGYDPRIDPSLYEELAPLEEMYSVELDHDDLPISTHPPAMKRVQFLSQAKIMDEALDVYRRALESGKPAEALDSWSSTFTLGHSWCRFWTEEWLQGVSILWNSVSNSVRIRPPERHNHARNLSRNSRTVVQAAVPANGRCNKGIIVGQSLPVQQDIYQTAGTGTGYASSWQLQNHADDPAYFRSTSGFPCTKLLWESGAPPKVKFFMWQLMHGRLWPADLPRRRPGLQGEKQCLFCDQGLDESSAADHVAFNCGFAKEIWLNILSWAGVPIVLPPGVPSVDVWWMHLRSLVAKDGRRALDTLLISTIWHLWLEQMNARFCTKENMTTSKLTIKIQQETLAWIGACAKHH